MSINYPIHAPPLYILISWESKLKVNAKWDHVLILLLSAFIYGVNDNEVCWIKIYKFEVRDWIRRLFGLLAEKQFING